MTTNNTQHLGDILDQLILRLKVNEEFQVSGSDEEAEFGDLLFMAEQAKATYDAEKAGDLRDVMSLKLEDDHRHPPLFEEHTA